MSPAKKFAVPGYLVGRPVTLAIFARIKDRLEALSRDWDLLSPKERLERIEGIVELSNVNPEETSTLCTRLMLQRYAADVKPTKRRQKKKKNPRPRDAEGDDSGYEGSSEETDCSTPQNEASEVTIFDPNKHVTNEEFHTAMENANTRIRELENIIQARNQREDRLNARIAAMRNGIDKLSAQDKENENENAEKET